jgi:hypothetical protein
LKRTLRTPNWQPSLAFISRIIAAAWNSIFQVTNINLRPKSGSTRVSVGLYICFHRKALLLNWNLFFLTTYRVLSSSRFKNAFVVLGSLNKVRTLWLDINSIHFQYTLLLGNFLFLYCNESVLFFLLLNIQSGHFEFVKKFDTIIII